LKQNETDKPTHCGTTVPIRNMGGTIDSSAQNSPIAYSSSNIDITHEIIRLCDQADTAKAAVPATKPGAATPRLSDSLSNPCGKQEVKSNLALYQY
jgi:hypothetical protein